VASVLTTLPRIGKLFKVAPVLAAGWGADWRQPETGKMSDKLRGRRKKRDFRGTRRLLY
jgi:hypothetical protein